MEELFLPAIELHGVNEVRQRKIHTAEPLVPELGAFGVELDIEKLKSHKSRGIDQIPVALIKAVVEKFVLRYIKLLFLFRIRRNCLWSARVDH
jgi:hypothetical protein